MEGEAGVLHAEVAGVPPAPAPRHLAPVAGGACPGPGRPPAARRSHAGLRGGEEVTSYEALAKQSNMTESNL